MLINATLFGVFIHSDIRGFIQPNESSIIVCLELDAKCSIVGLRKSNTITIKPNRPSNIIIYAGIIP